MTPQRLPDPSTFQVLETTTYTSTSGVFLLDQHLDRMRRSADILSRAYGIRCFHTDTTKDEVVSMVEHAASSSHSLHRVRMLASNRGEIQVQVTPEPLNAAGTDAPLPPLLVLDSEATDTDSVFVQCKTTHRDIYAQAAARIPADMPSGTQVLLFNKRHEITEGNIANVAVSIRQPDGSLALVTPPVSAGLLPGTMRAELLASGDIVEGTVTVDQFIEAARNKWPVFCMNSVRRKYLVNAVYQ
ncbi:hypothetical protein FB645_002007 [Coemansia sp. IMI 203386]|nr:hypothetical protein FB645_002007 [Coemansia sp. IMI 203386]